jgi:phage head maturation protease
MTRPSGPPTGVIEHRFASSASSPASYDKASHSCECVISAGAAVSRFYGTEILRIDSKSVDLSRVTNGGCPLLDSHSQSSIDAVLGRIDSAWIKGGQLYGKIIFAQTPAGRQAEAMVSRGELKGISAGYSVSDWEIFGEDGDVIDPEESQIRWDDKLTFTATRWQLLEASLCGVPADSDSAVRSFGAGATGDFAKDTLVRMQIRQRMFERQNTHDARRAVIGNTSAWRRGTAFAKATSRSVTAVVLRLPRPCGLGLVALRTVLLAGPRPCQGRGSRVRIPSPALVISSMKLIG